MSYEILNNIINYSSSYKATADTEMVAYALKDFLVPTLWHYLILAFLLFLWGLFMVINSQNLIKILIGIEFMLNAVCINFVAFNAFIVHDSSMGQIFSLIILAVGAINVTVGLALICAIFHKTKNIFTDNLKTLGGDGT